MCETIKRVLTHGDASHTFNKISLSFYFGAIEAVVHLLQIGFYQIGLYAEAIKYDPFIHYYEFQVYKNKTSYYEELEREVLQLKRYF